MIKCNPFYRIRYKEVREPGKQSLLNIWRAFPDRWCATTPPECIITSELLDKNKTSIKISQMDKLSTSIREKSNNKSNPPPMLRITIILFGAKSTDTSSTSDSKDSHNHVAFISHYMANSLNNFRHLLYIGG